MTGWNTRFVDACIPQSFFGGFICPDDIPIHGADQGFNGLAHRCGRSLFLAKHRRRSLIHMHAPLV
ncbi:hypothetical protein [Desulfosarcina alkanivorans]|nr:hypothetical protein [Desulfosarcina alkanivorans]